MAADGSLTRLLLPCAHRSNAGQPTAVTQATGGARQPTADVLGRTTLVTGQCELSYCWRVLAPLTPSLLPPRRLSLLSRPPLLLLLRASSSRTTSNSNCS